MDLRKKLATRFDKNEKDGLAQLIADDQKLFSELWELIKTEDSPVPEYGSWVLESSFALNPRLAEPHLEEMIEYFPQPNHNAIHRNLAKILAQVKIPEAYQGKLYDLCINRLLDPQVPVAIKAHSMDIAFNIAGDIPELREELALVIQDQMEFNSVGFKARGKRILQKIKKPK